MTTQQAGSTNDFLQKRRRKTSGKKENKAASQITKRLASLDEVQQKLLQYLESVREKAEWVVENVVNKKISAKKFDNNQYLQATVVLKIIQIGQLVADMEIIFPEADFWLENRKPSGERKAVDPNMDLPKGKLSFVDIKSCRNDHVHTTEVDVEQLYVNAIEFIPTIATTINVIMSDTFKLDQEDFEFLRSKKLTSVERLINIIDCNEQTGNILKKALFDRINGKDDFELIRNMKREERLGFLLAYENIAFSLNVADCNSLYYHYEQLGDFAQFETEKDAPKNTTILK